VRRLQAGRAPLLAVSLVLAAGAAWALAVEPFVVRRHDLSLQLPGLPASFDGYRILHLTDFESSAPGVRESQVAAMARRTPPDLVVVTGDLVDKNLPRPGRLEAYRRMGAWLSSLPSRDGTLVVQGHGERHAAMAERELEQALDFPGVRVLWDDARVLERGSGSLAIAGVRVRDYSGEGRWVVSSDGSVTLGPTARSSYLELVGPEGNFRELTGRLRFGSPRDAAGIMVNSLVGEGEDRLYLVQRHRESPTLAAAAHGSAFSEGLRRETTPLMGAWNRFRVRCDIGTRGVRLRARVWPVHASEPEVWHLDFTDAHDTRIDRGRLGLYARGPGTKEFADLRWEPAGPAYWREPRGADQLTAMLRRLPPGVPVALISHTPDIFPDAASVGVPLVLAGHTQGGQVRIPWIGALSTFTHLGRRYAEGLFEEQGSLLFINRGLGTTRVPVRFLAPPEAVFITLRPPA